MTAVEQSTLSWEPPGPGDWRGLHDHFPRHLTPEYQLLLAEGMTEGEAVWIEAYGFPVRTIAPAFVHGRVFISPTPLIGRPSDRMPPPWAMRLAVRALPAFRRRARAAERAVVDRPWLAEAERWFAVERPAWEARNRTLATVDLGALDDPALVEHLRTARAAAGDGYRDHFRLHGCDLIPTGLYLAASSEAGLDPVAAASLLAGWSPASRGDEPLPDWCLVTGYDLDERCVAELPALDAPPERPAVAADLPAEEALRQLVPPAQRAAWDQRLADARATYGVRDSNGILTAAWPVGLLRRAMLEAGRRLAERGRLDDDAHALELTLEELAAAVGGDAEPTATAVAARAAARQRSSAQAAPPSLGPPQDLPVAALPPAMGALAAALLLLRDLSVTNPAGGRVDLHGAGLGPGPVEGRACVAADPIEAMARFEPGDIVVTAGTCPAWNRVLALAGGVVTEEGGPLSHAAVIARELGLPAIVGCLGAMEIPDGARVRLDTATGRVHVLA